MVAVWDKVVRATEVVLVEQVEVILETVEMEQKMHLLKMEEQDSFGHPMELIMEVAEVVEQDLVVGQTLELAQVALEVEDVAAEEAITQEDQTAQQILVVAVVAAAETHTITWEVEEAE
jgi:hypothetical protein